MGSRRIRANRLHLVLNGAEHGADAAHVALICETEKSRGLDGVYRYYDPRWTFELTGVQSTEAASLWSLLWDHAGQIVPYSYAPHGNAVPTDSEPHFTGSVQLPSRPSLGGDASIRGTYTFDVVLDVLDEPTKVTA